MYANHFISAAAGAIVIILAQAQRSNGSPVQADMLRTVLIMTLAGFFGGVVVAPINEMQAFGAGAMLALAVHNPAACKRFLSWCTGGPAPRVQDPAASSIPSGNVDDE